MPADPDLVNDAFRLVYGIKPGAGERKAFIQNPPLWHPKLTSEHLRAIRAARGWRPKRSSQGLSGAWRLSAEQDERTPTDN